MIVPIVITLAFVVFVVGLHQWVEWNCRRELRMRDAAADARAKRRVEEVELKIAMEEVEKFLGNGQGEEEEGRNIGNKVSS